MKTETPISFDSGEVGFPIELATASQETVIRPLRNPRPECPICHEKCPAKRWAKCWIGKHEQTCRQQHRIKWLIRDILRKPK